MNILYINGHPDAKSFNAAIQRAYVSGIDTDKHEVQVLALGELAFDPVLRFGYREFMPEDADITRSQELVTWADHIVFAYPLWWGAAPSLLTGWIARVFTPGFTYNSKGVRRVTQHLKGKTADIIITSRAPRLMWGIAGNSGAKPLTRNLFTLTGIKKRKLFVLDQMSLKKDTITRRERFLDGIKRASASL